MHPRDKRPAARRPRHRLAALPHHPAALTTARQLVATNRFSQAEAILRTYLATDPRSAEAHRLLAYCLLRQNRPKEALPEYTSAAQIEPPTAEDLKNVAQAYTLLNDYPDATKWGTIAVQRNPADPNAWYSLGRIDYTAQRFQPAADCFRHALALAPRNVKAENNLGLALEALNHTDEAIAAYRQAIAWADADGQLTGIDQPLLNLSIVLIHRDKIDEALPLLTRAATVAPRDPRIHEQLGHLYLQKENLPAAAAEFEQASTLDPSTSCSAKPTVARACKTKHSSSSPAPPPSWAPTPATSSPSSREPHFTSLAPPEPNPLH